jgi:hypothetical protein
MTARSATVSGISRNPAPGGDQLKQAKTVTSLAVPPYEAEVLLAMSFVAVVRGMGAVQRIWSASVRGSTFTIVPLLSEGMEQ